MRLTNYARQPYHTDTMMRSITTRFALFTAIFLAANSFAGELLPTADGFRGIWYHIAAGKEMKYSGGFATYPQQIRPFAIYRREVNKTFFCYGGSDEKNSTLFHMVSYFDHATGEVARPRILMDKKTTDAHDNPCMTIDPQGYLWIFSNTHGPEKRSCISRSSEPYSIDRFDQIAQVSLSYSSPWYVEGHGIMLIQNRYADGRAVAFQTSDVTGKEWSKPQLLAQINGQYQISFARGQRVAVAFNYFPHGLDSRTNLYYIETSDFGKTWTTIDGKKLDMPLKQVINPALVHDYEADKLLVYLKDIQFDDSGHPILMYVNSATHLGDGQPRQWMIAHWSGSEWKLKPMMKSDHNYDFGQLYIEPDNVWRLIAPTDPGPQPGMTGGDMVMWLSHNHGDTWERFKTLTHLGPRNMTYAREPIDARDDFYAFWADGDPRNVSESRLYFTNKTGDHVWELPEHMAGDMGKPTIVEFKQEQK